MDRAVEHVAGVPAQFDVLEAGIVVAVVHRVPGAVRGVPRLVGQVYVRMVDGRSAGDVAWNGDATGVGEQVSIEPANPCHGRRLVSRLLPAGGDRGGEDRIAVR